MKYNLCFWQWKVQLLQHLKGKLDFDLNLSLTIVSDTGLVMDTKRFV